MFSKGPLFVLRVAGGGHIKKYLTVDILFYSLFFVFLLLGIRYQYLLLNYREWGDESETIVAAKMLAVGMRLYSEVFNHHGPLTFFSGVLLEKFGDFGVRGHRVPIAIMQVMAVVSIYKAPFLILRMQRLLAVIGSVLMILMVMPDIFGHMYKYQTIAGILLVVLLSQYTLPTILSPEKLNSKRVIFGNLIIASLPFLAITYLPIAILLFFASFKIRYFKCVIIGLLSGLMFNLIFLGTYGSFAGFLAFHLYLNAKVLPLYVDLQPGWGLVVNVVRVLFSDLSHLLSLLPIALSAIILARNEKHIPWRTAFIFAGLCSLLVRGAGFHGMPYFYAILSIASVVLVLINKESVFFKFFLLGFLFLSVVKVSLIFPADLRKLTSHPIPTETEFSRLVTEFTSPEDRIIAYSFQNFQYIVSGRLPASGHFFYLPWQEKYNENPKFGILIDACKQIKEAAPKVMFVDKWTVWDKYSWGSYAGCIQELLDRNYLQVPNRPYYVRKDLVDGMDEFFLKNNRRMIPSMPLGKMNSISIKMNEGLMHSGVEKKLTGIGIMFGTYVRTNPGVARLTLNKLDGGVFSVDFPLPELQDNKYKYFDVQKDSYVSGSIEWLTGGGVSTWESVDEAVSSLTCIKYIFADGSRGFTPGCPMF